MIRQEVLTRRLLLTLVDKSWHAFIQNPAIKLHPSSKIIPNLAFPANLNYEHADP